MYRFKQPSTFAGLGILAGLFASFFPQYADQLHAVAGAAGSLAVVLNEGVQK